MDKRRYILKNLDCPGCAAKIETALQKGLNDNTINVNFTNKTVLLKKEYFNTANEIVKNTDPGVELIDFSKINNDNEQFNKKFILTKIFLSLFFYTIALIYKNISAPNLTIEYLLFLIPYFLIGYPVILKSLNNLKNRQLFDENFLIVVATIGAIFIKELPEAVAVMLFYNIGEFLQDLAVDRSKKSITNLLSLKVEYATVIKNEKYITKKPDDVNVGEIIVVKPGEKIPLDGVVIEGESFIDTSALTGESKLKKVKEGDEILSGMINDSNLLKIKVTKPYSESTISKILDLVENATENKSKTEKFITKFAKTYTPIVVYTAVFIAFIPPLILQESYTLWIYRALILLVISCPCALVISIPLSYFAGIGKAAKNGIIVKGSNHLEALTDTGAVAFDKTGTLTEGVFKINKIVTKNGATEEEILRFAAYAEFNSNHPIAKAILSEYEDEIDINQIEEYEEIKGYGIKTKVSGKTVLVGNDGLMHLMNIEHDDCDVDHSVVYVAVDNKFLGYILIDDIVKSESKLALDKLKKLGIQNIIMLTGDNYSAASKIANQIGIKEFYANLLPQDKIKKVNEIKEKLSAQNKKKRVVFVGDGINDAPVIAVSDVGVAMGGIGSSITIEAADIIIMDDSPISVPKAIEISKLTKKNAKENIIFSLAVKVIFITLGIAGTATMWQAVFADVGVALIAVLNSMRIFIKKLNN